MKNLYAIVFCFFYVTALFGQSKQSFEIIPNQYHLSLNKEQGSSSKFIQYNARTKTVLRAVDYPGKAIEVFDVKTGKLLKSIKINLSGVGSFIQLPDENIWVHDPNSRTYVLLNKQGTVIKEIKQKAYLVDKALYLSTGNFSFSPLINYGQAIYASGIVAHYGNTQIDDSILKKTGVVEKIMPTGETTIIGKLATASLTNYYGFMNNYSITQNKNELVVAPFFSNEVEVIRLSNNTVKFVKLKTSYDALIKPLSALADMAKFSNADRNSYVTNNYSNMGIVYDQYRDIYYRFVRYPTKTPGPVECAIVVLDQKFNFLFEYKVDHKIYAVDKFFVTENGLALFNHKQYRANENQLQFDVLKLKK